VTFYACQNISAQDFGPDDIVNILEVILNKENYATNEKNADDDYADATESTDNAEYPTEPSEDISQTDNQNPTEPPEISDTDITTEPAENLTEPEEKTEPGDTGQTEDTPSNIYHNAGAVTGINILNVFLDAPEKFRGIVYPETVPMVDSLKKNIKELADFSPRKFSYMSFYIATTDAKLFKPYYGGGMLSDARRYRTEIVEVECNIDIMPPLEKSKETIVNDLRIAMQADDYYSDILCVPFDVQSELVKYGLLMNLKKIPFLNVHADYYNASATDAFTVNGNIFGLVSDLTFDPSDIYAVFYNRNLIKEYNLTDPVDIYKNGEWDYGGMFYISKELTAAAADLNNGAGPVYSIGIDKDDDDIINGLFISSGSKYFTARPYNSPVMSFAGEKTVKFIDSVSKMFSPSGESGMNNFFNSGESAQKDAFTNGNILFSMLQLDIIPDITNSAFDWGILPVPGLTGGYESATERVLHSFVNRNAMCISIPHGTRNAEACGIVISALSSVSHQQLKDIYVIEQMRFHLRDVDSVKILGDIINNIEFNQYHAFSTMPEIYMSTAGILKDAVNKRIDFIGTYEDNRTMLNEYFRNSDFFNRR